MMQTASPFYPSLSLSLHIQSQVVSSSTHIPRPHQPLSSRFKHLLQPNHPIFQSLPLSHPRRQETPQRQSSSRRHQQTLMDVIDDPFPSTSAAAKKPCLLPRSLTYHHTFPRRARDVSLLFWKNLPDENPKLSIADSRVVFYTTSLRGIRRTHEDCCAVRAILHGFRVAVDERDVSMDAAYRGELQGLIGRKGKPVSLPQVFVRGRYVGGAEEVRHLHEAGGTTYLCTEIATGIEFACKSITKRKLITKEDVEDVRREIQIMCHLSGHKNVVQIQGAYEDPLYVHIVMELCGGGELFDRIIQRGHYSERKAAELIKIVVGVVQACHSLGVMHRDLKPKNFLLANKDDDLSLKAIDFGLSVFFKPGQVFTDVVGSPYYVAPEVLCKHYGPEADVWTAGVILYILLSGVPPFWAETQQGIFDAVLEGRIDFDSEPWPLISDSAKDLIRKMICPHPHDRLTAHEVLCHPWICENGVAPDSALDPAVLSRLKQFSAMNKLKKMALRVIAESLSEEEIAGLREMFLAIDTDSSGAITFDELKAGLRTYGSTLKDTEIRDLMDAADVDNSGTIDYGEFIAATVHLNKLEHEEHLVVAFSYFDKDGSGYITVDELQQACKEHNMTNVFIEDIIKEVDQDNDGRIDYGEFAAMMRKGNMGNLGFGLGRRTMRNSLRMSTRE